MELGILKRIDDLRRVWKHEEKDFSLWLASEENLSLLGKEIGMDIILGERETPVGSFSLDILASEEGTGRKIVIENQLNDTNHDHLGKIITYAAGISAEVIVWIVKKARDEHRKAIDWLNEHTDEEIGFFLIEIELWQIGESAFAPKFNVVEKPNDWAKAMKLEQGLSETKQLQFSFWQDFKSFASTTDFIKHFTLRRPRPQHWYDLSIGMSEAHLSLTINSQKKLQGVELYIPDDMDLYNNLFSHKEEIEKELGFKMDWQPIPDGKASRIQIVCQSDLKNQNSWHDYFNWYIEKSKNMKIVFSKYR